MLLYVCQASLYELKILTAENHVTVPINIANVFISYKFLHRTTTPKVIWDMFTEHVGPPKASLMLQPKSKTLKNISLLQ